MRGHRLVAVLLAFFLWFPLAPIQGPPAQALITRAHYSLNATLDFPQGRLQVKEVVTYPNHTRNTLTELVFQVTPIYFDAFKLLRASVNGWEVSPVQQGTALTVPLRDPLIPGQLAVVELQFELVVPRQGGRFGMAENIMALGNWFPIASVNRGPRLASVGQPRGWDTHSYVDIGDSFTTEMADFSVELVSTTPVSVAHTGQLVRQDENRWLFEAQEVRDFALAISDRYERLSRTYDAVEVVALFLPGHAQAGAEYVRAAGEMLTWMNRTVGRYPYPQLTLAEVSAANSTVVGQEYPNLIFISTSVAGMGGGPQSYLSYLVHHEVAHQWFYGLVGNDQVYEPWVDEATVTWLSFHFLRENYPNMFLSVWQQRIGVAPGTTPRFGQSTRVNTSIYDYTANEGLYFSVVYRIGAAFVEETYQAMGQEAFSRFLRQYAEAFWGELSTGTAYLDMLQAASPVNLYPFIAKYFSYPRYNFKEPPAMRVQWPSQPWIGSVSVAINCLVPLEGVRAFAGDQEVPVRWTGDEVRLYLDSVKPGTHLFTVVLTDAEGRTAEFPIRATIAAPPPPEPTANPVPAQPPKYHANQEDTAKITSPSRSPTSLETTLVWMLAVGLGLAAIGIWSRLTFPASTTKDHPPEH